MKHHVMYGAFCGGDPRHFTPDEESCTPEEIGRWNRAVARFEDGPQSPEPAACETAGDIRVHFSGFGYGIMRYPCTGANCELCEIGDEAS